MSSWELEIDNTAALELRRAKDEVLAELDWAVLTRVRRYLPLKRAMDIVGSIVGLIAFSPAMIASAILILLTSPGPVFFRHKRLGQHGREFYCLKLRSMVRNAEQVLNEWLSNNAVVKAEFEKDFKLKNDPRIIPVVGKILRISSVDEVPQFVNILRGDMSLVGPRPIVSAERAKYGATYRVVSRVKPGLTGLWQVSGRNDIDYGDRVELDVRYIESLNFWQDVRIVMKTFRVMFKRHGAY